MLVCSQFPGTHPWQASTFHNLSLFVRLYFTSTISFFHVITKQLIQTRSSVTEANRHIFLMEFMTFACPFAIAVLPLMVLFQFISSLLSSYSAVAEKKFVQSLLLRASFLRPFIFHNVDYGLDLSSSYRVTIPATRFDSPSRNRNKSSSRRGCNYPSITWSSHILTLFDLFQLDCVNREGIDRFTIFIIPNRWRQAIQETDDIVFRSRSRSRSTAVIIMKYKSLEHVKETCCPLSHRCLCFYWKKNISLFKEKWR
jgi:hypothetical protein